MNHCQIWVRKAHVFDLQPFSNLRAFFLAIPQEDGIKLRALLAAVEFDSDISGQVLTNANEAGVLLNGVKPNAVRLMPPLNITTAEIDEGVDRLEQALGKI